MMALVTGGAASGKSSYAEQVAISLEGPHYYFAAMKPFGEEGARRIERHRALRAGKGFITVECYEGLTAAVAAFEPDAACSQLPDDTPAEPHADAVPIGSSADMAPAKPRAGTALLECLGNVVANELFADDGSQVDSHTALEAVLGGVAVLAESFENLIIVGNEVGGDGLRYDSATEAYIDVLGAASCALAERCDVVVECVATCPIVVKGSMIL